VAPTLRFAILGPVEATRDGAPIPLGGRKPRALLVLLLLQRGEIVPFEQLADRLWDGAPPPTAANALQVYVSQLRKALDRPGEPSVIETHPLGYRISIPPDALDLHRFEHLWREGRELLLAGDAAAAARPLGEALGLWHGDPLSDVLYDSFGAGEVRRLEELRLEARADWAEAELACGAHARLVGELTGLVEAHPLKERLACQLMLALYRCGRQADALAVADAARRRLDEGYGLQPSTALRDLERAILNQDASLLPSAPEPAPAPAGPARQIAAVALAPGDIEPLGQIAAMMAAGVSGRDVLLVRIARDEGAVPAAFDELRTAAERDAPATPPRIAAFSSRRIGYDLGRLSDHEPVDLLLAPLGAGLDGDRAEILEHLVCDVGLVAGPPPRGRGDVLVLFSGSDHDWAAVGAAASLARAAGSGLRLVGTATRGEGDASRLLATASLVTQRAFGVLAAPTLVEPQPGAVVSAATDARLVVAGLSGRWAERGLGRTREALARSGLPVILLRAGSRPSAWAPSAALTRYTWTAAPAAG
jgi:DNA-binding SARP family transcriptional activator